MDLKGAYFPKSVILCAVFFYVRYPVSNRDRQEITIEGGVDVDQATLNRWVGSLLTPRCATAFQAISWHNSGTGTPPSAWRRMAKI